jgi:general secretion pathway protein D
VPGAELKRKLNDLIVPELNVREAGPADVIEFLRAESKKLTSDKSEINFVWQVPADQKFPKITLNLKKVPMIDVIRYVTDLAKLGYRIDPHVVVIFVPEKTTPPPTASDVKPQ